MAFVDYYKVMGIKKDHPQDKIQEAYRKRVKQMHPDLHPDDPKAKAKFQMLQDANEVLKDPEKRRMYDKYGENWKNAGMYEGQDPFGGGFGSGGSRAGGMDMDLGDIFSDLFGRGFRNPFESGARTSRPRSRQESNHTEAAIDIDVWTALLGGEIIANTPNGKFKLKIAAGTQSGKKVKLAGKGGTMSNGTLKDLVITFNVTIPTNLSEKQKELIKQAKEAR